MNQNIELKQRTKQVVYFTNPFPDKKIKSLNSSCGCSKPSIKNNVIKVVYKAKSIPKHLVYKGYYKTSSYVTIQYIDGTKKLLYINAKITQ